MAGLFHLAYSLILHFSGSDLRFDTTVAFIVSLVLPAIFLVLSVKAERSVQEGIISFGEALKTSFLTYLVYAFIATIVGQLVFSLFTADDWNRIVDVQRNVNASMFGMMGLDQIEIDEELGKITVEDLKGQYTGVTGIMMSLFGSVFLGLIISLIISVILIKNPTP